MSRDDIIKMGQEAGFRIGGGRDGPDDALGTGYNLERFAALVAAAALAEPTINEMETVWNEYPIDTDTTRGPMLMTVGDTLSRAGFIKKQKPLTDEEIDRVWRSVDYKISYDNFRLAIARAIERAHGIGGEE